MFTKLTSLFKKTGRDFEAFQIEVSTYSSLECRACPRDIFGERWLFRNMSMATFERIALHFHRAQWVSFFGWGDPLENEQLFSMIRRAKGEGCLTGLSTNGTRLDEALCEEVLASGLDLMVVFLEAATHDLQETLFKGSDSKRILERVEGFIRLRNRHGAETPRVKLSFPMTRMNIRELPGLVPVAANMGVDEAIFHNLDYLPNEQCNILRAFYHESPTPSFEESLLEIREIAEEQNLPVKILPLKVEEKLVCDLNPHARTFFSVDGEVAPCPYLMIPKKGEIRRIFMNQETHVPQTSFGNVRDEDFASIWGKEAYRQFRSIFEERKKAEADVAQMLDVLSMSRAEMLQALTREDPPGLPEPCRSCYKAYGV